MYEIIDSAISRGDLLQAYELACAAQTNHPDDVGLRYRVTLALARMGGTHLANQHFAKFGLGVERDTDCRALGARLIKDRAIRSSAAERRVQFCEASQAYAKLFYEAGSYFAGVNAATLTYLSGDEPRAKELASAVLSYPEVASPQSYYAAATAAECALLLGANGEAKAMLQQAIAFPDANSGARASTLRQLVLISRFGAMDGGEIEPVLAVLRPPPVAIYCGHRFIERPDEAVVADAIASCIKSYGIQIAYGALACGADILFAEAILQHGGELHVVLPFAVDDFITQSVSDGGVDWVKRFHICLNQASSVSLASRSGYIRDPEQFRHGSGLAMGLALVRSSHLQGSALQIAIWDGLDEHGVAGTGRDVADWRSKGGETVVIAVKKSTPAISSQNSPPETANNRHQASILFSDFAGFSKLPELQLPRFWTEVMATIAAVLSDNADDILFQNAWGDALFAVISTPSAAARVALAIQLALRDLAFSKMGFPSGAGMRIALHHGPVYSMHDPVIGKNSFIGTEVTLAARIEPITPVGEVYATQSFAAMLTLECRDEYECQYVGRLPLAKNFGTIPMYHLAPLNEGS